MPKLQVTKELIESNLPTPPENFSYRVERFSPLVWRVWIINHQVFSYTADEVKSIWGFVKSTGDVVRPRNSEKITTEKVCKVTEIPSDMRYSVMVPRYTQLKTT